VELADDIVSFDESLLLFQLKERTGPTNDSEREDHWFVNKVKGNAIRQIKQTLSYLDTHPIRLRNDRGHEVALPHGLKDIRTVKLIVYRSGDALSSSIRTLKGHVSSSVGFIHFFEADDYIGVLRTLVTLPEVVDYLHYRERLCLRFPNQTNILHETCIVGHYLFGDEDAEPTYEHRLYLERLDSDVSRFEIFAILHRFKEKAYAGYTQVPGGVESTPTDYYLLLREFVRLNRTDLAAFKERFMWAWEHCGGEVLPPSRFASGTTGCGFVFVPLPLEAGHLAANALPNLTIGAKYDLKVDRCVGVVFRRDGEYRLLDWMLREHPWAPDAELDAFLEKSYPFGPKRLKAVPRYTFK